MLSEQTKKTTQNKQTKKSVRVHRPLQNQILKTKNAEFKLFALMLKACLFLGHRAKIAENYMSFVQEIGVAKKQPPVSGHRPLLNQRYFRKC